jgi:ribulose-5-phosphate 4-epimerase/fuculose-1-phosphate aldolase
MTTDTALAELKASVALACRVLAHLGLVDYLGHVSARLPASDCFVMSPRGNALGNLLAFTAADMLLVDLDGQVVDGAHPVPSEVFIHTEILRARPDVQSVVHTHQPMAVAFGLAGRPVEPAHHTGSTLLLRPVPTYDSPNMVVDAAKGRRVGAALGEHCLLQMRGHGVTAVGASVPQAALNAIFFEQQAMHNYRALQLGGLTRMTDAELGLHEADLQEAARTASDGGPWRYYVSLLPPAADR